MGSPFVGEIRMFGGSFAPLNWAFCDGQSMPIAEYETLYNLIGTTYGGDGINTFNLPNLQSRIPHHQGSGPGLPSLTIGQVGGEESVTLTTGQLPAHTHAVNASSGAASITTPVGNRWASWSDDPYTTVAPDSQLDPASVSSTGGSQPHANMPPFQALNFIISLFGIYPSQS